MSEETRLAIGELAEQAGVSRRTVRFYVQRGLIPQPLGRGRGEHYGGEHLAAVLRIKALQEQGETLEMIWHRLHADSETVAEGVPGAAPAPPPPARPPEGPGRSPLGQVWVRQVVLAGFELHVQGVERALSERQLSALARFLHELCEPGGET